MGIGMSIFLIATGAILRYAVNVTVEGVEIDTVGLILFMAGDDRPRRPDDYPTRRL
jgi:Domain of unknown function (DUF6458)